MKNIIMVMLFLLAFTVSANAQETKTDKKAGCCATASAEDKAKCHEKLAEMSPEEAAKWKKECEKACELASKKTANNTTQANANTAVATEDKKSCASGKSCCAGKAKKA